MRFPLSLTRTMASYLLRKQLAGADKFPLVLMLEPLHACNLTCTGCGRIREYVSTIKDKLTVEECLASVDECGAPIVSICGGEPMIYPAIEELVAKILERKKHIYLCTNGMFIRKKSPVQADAAVLLQRPPRRHGRNARPGRGARRESSRKRSKASRRPRKPASWSARTRRSTKKPT